MGTIFGWLSGGVLDVIGKSIIMPFIQAWMKSKDVDLEKFKTSNVNTMELAVAMLDANVRFAQLKAQYALAVLQWWPFRALLFILISISVVHYGLAQFDNTWWFIMGCTKDGVRELGDACAWNLPSLKGSFGDAEKQFLLFFIIAKPVDTAISGAVDVVGKYLKK